MITEIIVFDIPDDMTRDEVMANYRRSAPAWRANPGFHSEKYLYDAETRRRRRLSLTHNGGGAPCAEHSLARACPPPLDRPLVADNAIGQTIIDGEPAEL
jgi:hypothetical protein